MWYVLRGRDPRVGTPSGRIISVLQSERRRRAGVERVARRATRGEVSLSPPSSSPLSQSVADDGIRRRVRARAASGLVGSFVELNVRNLGADMESFVPSKEFQLVSVTVRQKIEYYNCCLDPFMTIHYTFAIRRFALTYVASIMIPLVSTTFLGFFAFALNPQSGERVGLCTTVLLTTAAIYIVAAEMIPKVDRAIMKEAEA